jgi:PPOX class probable F420-dependent enzyme
VGCQTGVVELIDALELARTRRLSVLVTIRANGRPQLSNVGHLVSEDGLIRISITADRAKYKNLLREPWAALHVAREDFYAYVVIESDAELSPIANEPDDDTVEELIALYRGVAGEHENWDEYRRAMVSERRVVARLRPTRAYGML